MKIGDLYVSVSAQLHSDHPYGASVFAAMPRTTLTAKSPALGWITLTPFIDPTIKNVTPLDRRPDFVQACPTPYSGIRRHETCASP